ncbi:MAG: phage major capsid protein [Planctomycetaceae bacterium]|nr:phage major capsid protein [Planctomycetaceae bacterium]
MNEEDKLKAMLNELLEQREKGLLNKADFIKSLGEKMMDTLKANFGDVEQLKKNLTILSDEIKTLRGGVKDCNVDQLDGLYKGCWKSAKLAQDFGLYVMGSVMGSTKAIDTLKARGYTVEKANTGGVDTSGGLLIPTQIIDGFIMLIGEYGVARRNAMVIPMTSDTASAFKLTSGLTVTCTAEGVTPDIKAIAAGMLTLNAQEWNVLCAVDRTLDEDAAIMLGSVIGELMAAAFAEQEDAVVFMGDGTSTYFARMGIKGWFTNLTTPKGLLSGSGTSWSALKMKDFTAMLGAIHPKARAKKDDLKWYCSPEFYYNVMLGLADDAGGAALTEMINAEVTGNEKFRGRPVEFVEQMPSATASGQICCYLGNLKRGVYIGDRRETTIEQDRSALFTQRQVAIMGTERIAINVYGCHDVATSGTTKAGTIVALKTTT